MTRSVHAPVTVFLRVIRLATAAHVAVRAFEQGRSQAAVSALG